jgi:D-alanine transaminase
VVYLNGVFLPLAEARVPVLDRGFIFGDAVYEVIPVYARAPFRLEQHLARLEQSLAGLGIANPHTREAWRAILVELVARQPFDDQALYLQVTRGVAPRDPLFPAGVQPTVFAMANPLRAPAREHVEQGVAAITAGDDRWLHCDLKTTALVANVLLRQRAAQAGAIEAILFRDGRLTEGSTSSVFVVRDGRLMTPPPSPLVLPGISAGVVAELARAAGEPVLQREIERAEVFAADELWIASSSKEVLAVVSLDGQPVGDGRPGPAFRRMHALYQDYKRKVL